MPGGRPRNHNKEDVEAIKQLLQKYVDETEIPILVEFAYINEISRQDLYDYDEFSTLRKRCIDKKEAQLERKALENTIDKTMAIFSLKQLGWSDKQELGINGKLEIPKIEIEFVSPKS